MNTNCTEKDAKSIITYFEHKIKEREREIMQIENIIQLLETTPASVEPVAFLFWFAKRND